MLYRIVAVLALLFFTACASSDAPAPIRKAANQAPDAPVGTTAILTPQQPTGRIVKIGLLVPLTGDAAAVGNALQDAATLAIADRYGTSAAAADETRVVLVPKDTGGSPEIAAEATRQVLASGADLIIGPLFSTQVKAVADVARPAGVNVITFSNNPEVAGGNVFVFGFQVEQQVERILNYALNQNVQNIALLAPNNPYGQSVQKSAKPLLTSSNAFAAEAYYNPNSTPTTELDQIAAQNAVAPLGAILLPETGQKLQATVKGLAAKGVAQPTTRLLGTGLWDEAANLRSGVLTGGWFPSSPPERFSAYEKRFNNYFGYAPPRISSLAYDAVALAAALVSNSVETKVGVAAITEESGFVGPVNGLFRCKRSGICERGLAVLEVTAKGARVIDPAPSSF
ncbi:MAG: penicillin-binding protein activator [Alphaproteobacteria bacterium]|nr:penicillin-binding protein activator [Alphaproteobacteria bacterium]